jgi:hypothetical protein
VQWFDVSKKGLAKLLQRKGRAFAILELIQNGWDEETRVLEVKLAPAGRGKATLTVTDDNPEGFKFIEHAYTLFAESTKKADPTKRGRFNLGEKLFLAICDEAVIYTTKGTVTFNDDGRSVNTRRKRPSGTEITATVNLTLEEQSEVERLVHTLRPPAHVKTIYNGWTVHTPAPIRTFEATLPTEQADEEGILRPSRRKTTVELFELLENETPHIYEMGIPVCEHDGKFHVNVMQKVPLNFNRDNVTPAYLRQLRENVLNNTFDLLTQEDAHKPWVAEALPNATDDAFKKVITERFGEKVAIFDPSCPEANARAQVAGYTVIHGRQLPPGSFARMREAGIAQPTGSYQELRGDIPTGPEGTKPLERSKWTPGMERIAKYATDLAQELIQVSPSIDFYVMPVGAGWRAGFGKDSFMGLPLGKNLIFNVTALGHAWFNDPDPVEVDRLLIHEFAHNVEENHLDDNFHRECCRLGAKLRWAKTTL